MLIEKVRGNRTVGMHAWFFNLHKKVKEIAGDYKKSCKSILRNEDRIIVSEEKPMIWKEYTCKSAFYTKTPTIPHVCFDYSKDGHSTKK